MIIVALIITHLLAFRAVITTIITFQYVLLSAIPDRVDLTAPGGGVLIILASAVAKGPAAGILIYAATAASEFCRMVVGTL